MTAPLLFPDSESLHFKPVACIPPVPRYV